MIFFDVGHNILLMIYFLTEEVNWKKEMGHQNYSNRVVHDYVEKYNIQNFVVSIWICGVM